MNNPIKNFLSIKWICDLLSIENLGSSRLKKSESN